MATKVIIDIKSLGITWVPGNSYTVNVGQGFVNQAGVDKLPNSAQSNLVTFTTPATGPSVASVIPAYNATNIASTTVTLGYDRGQVFGNTGNFYIYRKNYENQTDILVATVPVSSVTVNGSSLTLNLLGTLDGGYTYFVTADTGVVKDVYDFQSTIINSEAIIKFTTDEYGIASVTPTYDAVNVYNTTVVLTFERAPTINIGNFYLYKNGSLDRTIPITDSKVTKSGNNISINLFGILEGEATYYLLSDFGIVRDVNLFNFKGIPNDSTMKFSTGLRPYVSATDPVNLATDVYDVTPTLTINRSFTRRTGNIYIYSDTNPDTLVATISINSPKVTVTGNDITIDLLGILEGETTYYITADAKILEDQYKFTFKGISDDTVLKFSTGLRPYVSATDPVNLSTDVYDTSPTLTMNRSVTAKTGNFYVYSGNTLISTISINDPKVTISGNNVTIDLLGIIDGETTYYITADAKILEDQYKFTFKGINNDTVLKFSTGLRPYITSTVPVNLATNVYNVTPTLNFYNALYRRTGNFYIYSDTNPDTLIATIPVNDSKVTVNGNVVTINLLGILEGETTYYITSDPKIFENFYKFTFKGISDDTVLKYSTGLRPYIVSALSFSYDTTTLNLTINNAVTATTGNFYLYTNTTPPVLTATIPVTDPRITITGTIVKINLFGLIQKQTDYYITSDAKILEDQYKFTFRGINDNTTLGVYRSNIIRQLSGTTVTDKYGVSVAASNNYIIVGAPYEDNSGNFGADSGRAYIYSATSGILLHTLINPNAFGDSYSDRFGSSVAISDNYAIVGAPFEDDGPVDAGSESGKAYIYSTTTGELLYTLNNPKGVSTNSYDNFGISVGITDTHAIVGAPYTENPANVSTGVAYIYSTTTGELLYTLNNPNGQTSLNAGDNFGFSVAISGNRAIVGAYWEDNPLSNAGSAYIYSLTSGNLLYTLNDPNGYGTASNDWFGYSVAISDTHAIVGAYRESDAGGTYSGKAYVYSSNGQLLYTLNNPNPVGTSANDLFGSVVAISGNYAIVGASQEDTLVTYPDVFNADVGKAYIYSLTNGQLLYTLNNPNSYETSANDQFGYSVAITNNYALIGSPGESKAYLTKFV